MATTPHVRQLIEEAYSTQATFLDLGNCGLTNVPVELEKLALYLTGLNLGSFYQDSAGGFIDSPYKVAPNVLSKSDWSCLKPLNKLRSLFVTRASLTAVDAQSLAELSSLTDLFMGSNSIGDEGVQAIVQLQDLVTLDLGNNGVSQRGAKALARLRKVKTLYLSWNGISDDGVDVLAKLNSLTHLDIGNNKLGPLGAQRLSKLRSLVHLNLYRNKIGPDGMQALTELSALTTLNISGNNIGSEGAAWLVKLRDLTDLDVSYNDIGDQGAQAVGQLSKLRILNINRNKIKVDGAKELAQLTNLTTLNIGDNELSNEGMSALSTLTNLTNLNVSDNLLGDDGILSLVQLSNLDSLNVHKNQIGIRGAQALAQLQKLTSLNISANQLGNEGTVTLAQLDSLSTLDIANNSIGPAGAQALTQLQKLTDLNIADNRLGEEGASTLLTFNHLDTLNASDNELGDGGAKVLAQLKPLKRLDLRRNEIKEFPIEQYRNLLLHSLQELLISDNPIQNLSLSDLNDIQALKGLVESLRVNDDIGPSRHLKISLLGHGMAGKTSFADFLIKKKYKISDEERTHGILQYQWRFLDEFEAQLWDFGGQDYYHGTHHLFLREENIFLIFWHPGENLADIRSRYCYWLGNTRYFTQKSTVFLIQTKSDVHSKIQVAPEDLLTYAVEPEHIFCISVLNAQNGIATDKRNWKYLVDVLEDSAKQLAEKRPINQHWVTIRENLCANPDKEFYLSEEQFHKKYFPAGSHNELAGLLSYLEFSGTILRFQQIESLQKRLYLDPKELTESIYRVFDQTVMAKGGIFDYHHLEEKVGQEANAYLELMMAYDLIFESSAKTYVVPQYLPDYPGTVVLQTLEHTLPLSFALYYPDYLHQGLIFAFIAQYGRLATSSERWRYGLLFEDADTQTRCLVRCDLSASRIYIHLDDTRDKLKVAARLFDYFAGTSEINSYQRARKRSSPTPAEPDGMHRDWGQMPHRLAISIDGKQFMDIRGIRDNISNGIFWGFTLDERKRIPLNATLHYLLHDSSMATIPKKIFFSYSHKDEVYKQELDAHLASLKRGGKIEAWHDRKILPGDNWDETILEQLISADIVLLLLSADFINSDYIWKKEVRTAIEQRALKPTNVIPIFLRPCDFDLPELQSKQGIPRDARWIVSSDRPNRDEGYLQVVQELKALL